MGVGESRYRPDRGQEEGVGGRGCGHGQGWGRIVTVENRKTPGMGHCKR